MSFWWIWGIYFMDHVVLRNDFGMDKKLGAVSGGLGIVRVMAAAWLISVMISAVGMVLASLIFYAVGERVRQNPCFGVRGGCIGGFDRRYLCRSSDRIQTLSVGAGAGSYILCHTLPDFSGITDVWLPPGGSSVCLLCCFALAAGCWEECLDKRLLKKVRRDFLVGMQKEKSLFYTENGLDLVKK